MNVEIEKEQLIFCAPINEYTKGWGVYCIPRMWRLPNGNLAIYFNGTEDSPEAVALKQKACPDMFFISRDNGECWQEFSGEGIDLGVLGNVDSPYCPLSDGKVICVREKEGLLPVRGCVARKTFYPPFNGGGAHHTYRQADIPSDAFACELLTYNKNGDLISRENATIDFPERELLTVGEIPRDNGFVSCPEWIKAGEWCEPYIASIKVLAGGVLCGTCYGQNPNVKDRYCGETYFMVSEDGGKSWKKRSCITKNSGNYPFGLSGDGYESSLAVGDGGRLYFVARMDMSIDHTRFGGSADTVFFVSEDYGYTWSEEKFIADSSVTPHVLTFGNEMVVVIYGRPGVHMIYSTDGGITFSEPISIIGKTLTEELSLGKNYMQVKYASADSYSNTFVEKVSENSFLILYTDLKYDNGDGLYHKAGLVKRINIAL